MVKRLILTVSYARRDREYAEYLVGKALLWFGYFACLGLLVLLGLRA